MNFTKDSLVTGLAIVTVIGLGFLGMLSAKMFAQNIETDNLVAFFLPIPLGLTSVGLKLWKLSKRTTVIGLFADVTLVLLAYNPTSFIGPLDFFKSFLDIESHIILPFTIFLWLYYFREFRKMKSADN